jgi:hypothetical protein
MADLAHAGLAPVLHVTPLLLIYLIRPEKF